MINFGYKKRFESIARAFIAIGLGVCLFIFKDTAVENLVKIIGVAILFAGVISIVPMLSKKDSTVKRSKMSDIIGLTTCGIASVIGLLAILMPSTFSKVFIFILAAAIIVFCAIQLIALISAMEFLESATLPMIFSAAALIGAIVVMFFKGADIICYLLGSLLVIYGLSELFATPKIWKAEKAYIAVYGPVKDAKAKETKPQQSAAGNEKAAAAQNSPLIASIKDAIVLSEKKDEDQDDKENKDKK